MLPDLQSADLSTMKDLAIGGAAALASGLVAIWVFVRMLDRSLFHHWAWYCWGVGGAFVLWSLG